MKNYNMFGAVISSVDWLINWCYLVQNHEIIFSVTMQPHFTYYVPTYLLTGRTILLSRSSLPSNESAISVTLWCVFKCIQHQNLSEPTEKMLKKHMKCYNEYMVMLLWHRNFKSELQQFRSGHVILTFMELCNQNLCPEILRKNIVYREQINCSIL